MQTPHLQELRPTYARVRSVSVEILVVAAGIATYFGIRGQTAGTPEVAKNHAADIVGLEQRLNLYHEAWLQKYVVDSDTVSTVFNWIYIWGHWPVIIGTLLWLALRHRTIYLRLRNGMMASGGLGLLVYTTYPVAPPRLADLGLVDTVSERSHAYRILQPPAFVNQYAAMPSLHVGWDLLVGLALIAVATTVWLRLLGVAMPVLMAVATVATANHYVLDVLAGLAFALAGHAVALAVERRREARDARRAAAGGQDASGAGGTGSGRTGRGGAHAAGPDREGAVPVAAAAGVPVPRRSWEPLPSPQNVPESACRGR